MNHQQFDILYIDCPWQYRNKRTGGSLSSGAATQYPTLTIEELCELPIPQLAAKNSILGLWSTVPLLPEALQVMAAWDFRYKTKITWRKTMSLGMGYWFRGQVEDLLVGIRGKVKAFRCQKPNFIETKVLKHSEKPECFRHLIEEATANMPSQRRVEVFARTQVPGWCAIGNEVDRQDIRDRLQAILSGRVWLQEQPGFQQLSLFQEAA